ncbi:MAG TPA: glycerophosphodiester phosphodiesterase family protein [Aeromicrobium sp.]|nr:glycerophosphodiester phosphodiesterase family protein [Aeromicrobium sp.]
MIDLPRLLLIAHRGFPGLRHEHTRPSYDLAIDEGADYIEPDIVATKDGRLVVRHENEISGTTDVADRPEFADRRTTKVVDGSTLTGWFTEDFTLAELKTLRTRERIPDVRPRNTGIPGEEILTFDEVVEIATEGTKRRGWTVGIYVETKHPSYFAGIGLDLNDLLIDALERNDLNTADAPVIVQSFESGNLRDFDRRSPLFLVRLVSPKQRTVLDDLADIASFADAIGPHKDLVIPRNKAKRLGPPTDLVERSHAAGLDVHIWTMRDEPSFLPAECSPLQEYVAYFEAGVDGLFSDWTTTAVQARRQWQAARRPAD